MRIPIKNYDGFTLIELIIFISIMIFLIIGVTSLIVLSIQLNTENQNIIEAIAIANQKMERIRNLSYDQVGVVGGIPYGPIPPVETITRNGVYTINTYIIFEDDPFDGEAGPNPDDDDIPIDYKIATVKVSWQTKRGWRNVTIFSKIIPRTEETLAGYGLLKILVVDADGAPLPAASVHIINTLTATSVDVTNLTNQQGLLYFPAYASFQGYKVIVSKVGHGLDQTFPITPENPQPTKVNLSVTEGDKTEESFSIDLLATLRVRTVTNNLPTNWRVNELFASSTKSNERLARDGSNNLYFTWQNSNATSTFVYVQKFNSSRVQQWLAEKKVYNSPFQKFPDIVTTDNGRSYVVWRDDSVQLKSLTLNTATRFVKNNPDVIVNNFKADDYFNEIFKDQDLRVHTFTFWPRAVLSYIKSLPNFTQQVLTYLKSNWHNLSTSFAFLRLATKSVMADTGTVTTVGVGPGATTGNTNNIVLSVPAGVQNGDLLLAYIHHDDYSDGPMDRPSGYGWQTLVNNLRPSCSFFETTCDSRGGIFWKIVAAGDPGSYTFTLHSGNNEQKAGHIRAYRGIDTSNPFDGNLNQSTSPTGDMLRPAPNHTVNSDGSMLVTGWGADTPNLGNVLGGPTFPIGMSNTLNNYATDITAASADLMVNIVDSPTGDKNYDANKNVDRKTINWSLVIKPAILPDDVTVSATGNQIASMVIPGTDLYIGGGFILMDNTGNHTISSVTISEQGTVDADNSLANVKLYYDFDITAPYDCADQTFSSSTDPQFGITTNFNGNNGQATFSPAGGINITTTKTLCLYTVVDVNANAGKDQTIEIEIDNPSADVVLTGGTVIPNTYVSINGTTNLLSPPDLNQIHYRWRNDDDNEASSTWRQVQDTAASAKVSEIIRLRLEITNRGSLASAPTNFRLEYGQKITTCDTVASWQAVPNDDTLDWKIFDSAFITDGATTTNNSGLSDENSDFLPGETKDINNQTSALTLTGTQFTEIEYAIKATNNVDAVDYCFRVTKAGSTVDLSYTVFPELNIIGDGNIYILGLNSAGNELWGVKRVNTDVASEDQTNPRLALIENDGIATTVVAWEDRRSGNYDIYAQSFDNDGNKIWVADLPVATSANNESRPAITITNDGKVFIVWVAEEAENILYFDKYDLIGNHLIPSPLIIATSTYEYSPELITGEDNYLYLALTNKDDLDKNVSLIKLDTDGNEQWSHLINADSTEYDQYAPSLAYNNFIFSTWTDKREGNEDIYTQKFDINGNRLWPEDQRININNDATNQNSPMIIITTDGDPVATWSDGRNNDSNIYATQFSDPGSLSGVAGVPITITGTSRIGENPIIYEHVEDYTTDGNGYADISVEWDIPGYAITLKTASTSLNLIFSAPTQPVQILPAQIINVLLYVQ